MADHEGRRPMVKAYAVVHGDYKPVEVDSIWVTREAAEARARSLGCVWRVTKWKVRADNFNIRREPTSPPMFFHPGRSNLHDRTTFVNGMPSRGRLQ